MTFLRLFLNCGTMFIVATAFSTNEKNESDIGVNRCFPDYIIPEKSDIVLIPYVNIDSYILDVDVIELEPLTKEKQAKSNFFYGVSITVINIIQPTRNITFRLWKPQINELSITLTKISKIDEIQQLSEWYLYTDATFILVFEDELKPGNYTLRVKFFGTIPDNRESFFVTTYINETGVNKYMVTGDLEKIRARYVFPCLYELRLKSKLSIFMKYHEKYLVLSNIRAEIEYINDANNMGWTKIHITSIMSTYFMAIPISDFASYSHNVPYFAKVNMWCRRHMMQYMNFAWNVAKNVTTYLEYILHAKNLENFSKVNQSFVVIPNLKEEDISIRELIFLREEDIIYEESDHTARKIEVARLITRTVIYNWLGSTQFSINAGLMMFLEAYVIDKSLENSRMMDLFVVQNQHESLHLFSDFNMDFLQYNNISKIISLSSLSNYFQIPYMIRMLQHLISDKVFWMGIRKYVQTHAFNSTNFKDFWVSMQAALEESDYMLFNITEMASWTKLNHYPILMIRHHNNSMYIGFQNFISYMHNWSIPMTFASQSKPGFTISFHNIMWLRNFPLHVQTNDLIDLKDDDWIIANIQQAGYCRINYDTNNWAKIAKYLNSWHYSKIHVLNRAQIIDDAFHFAIEKKLNISIFWNLANYLSQDTDYIAWYPMIKAFQYMSSIFPLPDKRVQNIKDKINGIFGDLLTWTGYIENTSEDDFSKYLKQELAKWACNFNDSWCMKIAARNLELHLEYPEKHKVLPWLKEWTYCKGLMSTGNTTWQKVMNIWMKKRDNKILEFLACSQNITIIEDYLSIIASKTRLQDNEDIYSFHSIIAKHVRNNKILDSIISYFIEIKPRRISTITAIIDIINHIYSEQQLDTIRELMQYVEVQYRNYVLYKIKKRLAEIGNQMDFLQIFSGI